MKVGNIALAVVFGAAALACTIWLGRMSTYKKQPVKGNGIVHPPEATSLVSKAGPYPKVVIDEPEYDFGVMETGAEGHHEFTVRNEGEAPLEMKLEKTSCSCTIGTVEDKPVAPGESTKIELKWTIKAGSPEVRQTARIQTNDPAMEYFEVAVSGGVTDVLGLYPYGNWYMGNVIGGESFRKIGTVYSAILDEFNVLSVETENKGITIGEIVPLKPEELASMRSKSGYAINAKPSRELPVGIFRDKLTVKTDVRGGTNLDVVVEGHRNGPIQILGDAFSSRAMMAKLGTFPASQGKTVKLTMFVRDLKPGQDLQFLDTVSDPPQLKVSIEPKESLSDTAKSYWLTFELPPGLPPMTRANEDIATITVKTNHPEMKQINFRVQISSR